jgi:hypothetical protein
MPTLYGEKELLVRHTGTAKDTDYFNKLDGNF